MTKSNSKTALREAALRVFAKLIQTHYGRRLKGVYRVDLAGDYEDEDQADAYLAVVLTDGNWRSFDEVGALAGLAYDALEETDVYMRALPISQTAWNDPTGIMSEIDPATKARAETLMEMA